jgi:hypothetical protein
MTNDLSAGLLVVLAVLAGLAGLLVLLTALDPTNVRRKAPSRLAVDGKGGATGTGGTR